MRTEQYDVAIVGGGPAGSNAARMIREYSDKSVLLLERNEEPTANCAGGLGLPFFKHMGVRPPDDVILSTIKNVTMASPNHEATIGLDDFDDDISIDWIDGELDELGWVLDRQAFDNWLLDLAEDSGVDVRRKHMVKEVDQSSDEPELTVMDRDDSETFKVNADYIGLATGPTWELAIQAGFDEDKIQISEEETHMGLQYHMHDPDYNENYGDETIYLLFDDRYAPKGYVWSFSEGGDHTKWGAGIPMSEDMNVKDGLSQYLKDNGKWEAAQEAHKETMAVIPTAKPLETAVEGKVGLIGDVAHHCDPVHGGGSLFGSRAGKQFARAVSENDIESYDGYWKDDFLDTLQHRFMLKDMIYSMDNDELDRFIEAMEGFNVEGINPDVEIPRMMWHIFKNDKGIFTQTAAETTKSIVKQKLTGI